MRRTLCSLLLTLLPMAGSAETVCEVAAATNGSYIVMIDGKRYVALSAEDAARASDALAKNAALAQQLAETTAKLKEYQSLTAQYDALKDKYAALTTQYKDLSQDSLRLNSDFSTAAHNLVALNQDYSQLVHDYDALTEQYRSAALRSHPRNPLDIGIGAISSDNKTNGVVMVGAGTRLLDVELRGWLLGGPDSYGMILGTSF